MSENTSTSVPSSNENASDRRARVIVCGDGFIGRSLPKYGGFEPINETYQTLLKYGYKYKDSSEENILKDLESRRAGIFVNASGATDIANSFSDETSYLTDPVAQVENHLNILSKLDNPVTYIFLSSGAVYGNTRKFPTPETHPCNPLSPYAAGKILAERRLEELGRELGIKCLVFRIFSAYSNELSKQLPYYLASQILSKNTIELFGNGDEIRDFVHISDIAKVIYKSNSLAKGTPFSIFNLGSGKGLTINDVAAIAVNTLKVSMPDREIKITFSGNMRLGDPRIMWADISKIKAEIGDSFISPDIGLKGYFANYFAS